MSFGKRPPRIPNQTIAQGAAARSSDPQDKHSNGSSIVRFLTGISTGLIIASLLYTAYVQGMRQLGKQLNQKFETQMNETVGPTPQLALLKTKMADGWDLGKCRMFKPPSAIDDVWPSRYANRDESEGGFISRAGGDISIALANKASFLDCVVNRETKRLCTTDLRAAFAKDATELYGELAQFSRHLTPGAAPQDTEFTELLKTIESAHPDVGISDARKRVGVEVSEATETLEKSLQYAIAAGYISSADFGWFAPGPVKAMLASTPVQSNSCP